MTSFRSDETQTTSAAALMRTTTLIAWLSPRLSVRRSPSRYQGPMGPPDDLVGATCATTCLSLSAFCRASVASQAFILAFWNHAAYVCVSSYGRTTWPRREQ